MQTKPPNPTENKSRNYLKMLKIYGIIALAILILFSGFGYFTGGIPGLMNGFNLALIACAVGLPFLGILISLTYWSEFAGRWGEEKYKEQLEGKPEHKKD
ncbi:MAG: hypothetical protein VB026_07115 [Anaerolineaceae bacterium]|nr:hypothetical protein [Anaerolineaceae bacterium]